LGRRFFYTHKLYMIKLANIFALSISLQVGLIASPGITLAQDYQKNSGLQWEWATESLRNFAFAPGDKVLDVGCGDGKITALIAQQLSCGVVMGMDISEKMIAHASQHCQAENLTFFQGNAVDIPYREQFDKVISFCTLHWVLDQERALISMNNSLKQSGALLLVIPAKCPNNIASIAELVVHSEKWLSYFPDFKQERVYFSASEYADLLHKAHFDARSIVESESITLYPNKAALIAWIRPVVNFIDHLATDEQNAFIEDMADQMLLNTTLLSDGSIPIRHVKMEVVAVKL